MKQLLSFDNVNLKYGDVEVLSGLSFDVNEKDAVGIFGRSGTGKSTLLKLVAGLLTPSEGSVRCRAGRIGYVFQETRALPWKTALDNVALPLTALGRTLNEARTQAASWLREMELQDFMDYYPAQLSGGMAQRISLARAFAVEPELLILDEPFGALDLQLKDTMFALVRRLLDMHETTVLYVSHVPEDVIRVANRILVLGTDGGIKEMPVMEREKLVTALRDTM